MNTQHELRRSPLSRQASQIGTQLMIKDLTHCQRIGFKGTDTMAWLESMNVDMPQLINHACELSGGGLNARLSATEFLFLHLLDNNNDHIESLRTTWSMDITERTYLLERGDSHSCFEVCGEKADEMFAKICGVDLRPHKFTNLSVAQTSVGRMNSIVIRYDKDSRLRYLLLADITAAEYLWNVVADAATEFN